MTIMYCEDSKCGWENEQGSFCELVAHLQTEHGYTDKQVSRIFTDAYGESIGLDIWVEIEREQEFAAYLAEVSE